MLQISLAGGISQSKTHPTDSKHQPGEISDYDEDSVAIKRQRTNVIVSARVHTAHCCQQ